MKQLLVLAGCAVFLSGLAGCQDANRGGEGEGHFPAFLVGVWQVEQGNFQNRWGFKFEPDGTISKIIHSVIGPVNLAEEGIYLEGPDPNTYAMFVMGPCEAKYDSDTRELSVEIVLDFFRMQLPEGELEGKSHDYFNGPVSKDCRSWQVKWRNYGWLEGAAPPDANVIEAHPEPLVFTKLDLAKLKGG
jgi:hypothetical protein